MNAAVDGYRLIKLVSFDEKRRDGVIPQGTFSCPSGNSPCPALHDTICQVARLKSQGSTLCSRINVKCVRTYGYCNCSELNLTIALISILHSPFSIFNYCNKKGTLFRGFLFMQLWFVKRRNYSSTLTYTPPLRQDSVAALAMRTGRRPSTAPTATGLSLLIASTKEITWLMNAWL